MEDPKDFYSKYVRNLQSNYEPLNQDFHEKMLKVSTSLFCQMIMEGIPKAADKSHCALYTNDCNLTALNTDDYSDESSYIEI